MLADYSGLAPKEFWAAFPSNPLPAGPTTAVRVDRLKILIRRYGKNWSAAKKRVAKRAIKNLSRGAKPAFKRDLPAVAVPNAGTATLHGREITDTIADWVSKGYVAGPLRIFAATQSWP